MFFYFFLLILITYYFIHVSKKEGFHDKCLIVLYGEAFRDGKSNERIIDTETGFNNQMLACDSHLKFIDMLKTKYSISTDVVISTYETKYENELKEKYKNNNLIYKKEKELIGWDNIMQNGIKNIDLFKYKFILFTRNDVFLKDQFINEFILYDKITYLSQNLTVFDCYVNKTTKIISPSVNPSIIYVPNKYFNIIHDINADHTSWYNLKNKYNYDTEQIGFMLNTHHDANTYTGWNPYYKFIGRDESQIWIDKDKINIYLQNKECYTKVELD